MDRENWSYLWHSPQLNLSFFQAFHSIHAYPRHSHDYYVVALVDRGLQSFRFGGSRHITPVDGLILLNPGDVHTGEPVDKSGFGFSAFYPTEEHLETLVLELSGRHAKAPVFSVPRADDAQMAQAFRSLHTTLKDDANPLECESKFIWMLVELIRRYGNKPSAEQKIIAAEMDMVG